MKVHILLLMFGFVAMFESASGFGLLHKGNYTKWLIWCPFFMTFDLLLL